MTYKKLPPVREDMSLELSHFPNNFYAAVFRFWETVDEKTIAKALNTTVEIVQEAASEMGLPKQKYLPEWKKRGYITTIRNAWHILPYENLLTLVDMTEDELSDILKTDDFLEVKLGSHEHFKPYCQEVRYMPPDAKGKEQLERIKKVVQGNFSDLFDGSEPFEFSYPCDSQELQLPDGGIKMVYSYCGLYAKALDNDISLSYPKNLLKAYKNAGVNAVWLPVLLSSIVPFEFDESLSNGWQKRTERLRELVKNAAEYGIKVYLYLNEPRCLPMAFFDSHKDLLGASNGREGALCTSADGVLDHLYRSVKTLCENVPDIGGFFVITMSENLTHCKSVKRVSICERCKDVPIEKLAAEVLCTISEASRSVDPNIKTIAWTWAWEDYMTKEQICNCIDLLPKEIIIQSNSEAHKPFEIGGVKGIVRDYSMSIPGPAPVAKSIWDHARERGHQTSAKVQVNVTWECSTLPFLPVFDLLREHMMGLKKEKVEHLMLSWTLGGFPSVNFKLASLCLADGSDEAYDAFLKSEYGEYADKVKKAAKIFSDAFREFPFDIGTLYRGPQNAGPSNLLFPEPTGFISTMTCYSYDDLENWRSIYPKDVFISQLEKLYRGWEKGLCEISDMPDNDFKNAAYGGYALFYSSYLQSVFVDERDKGNKEILSEIAEKERELALLMYDLMRKSNFFGYEAANHYYFNKGMLAEKVICCEEIINRMKNQ